MSGAEGARLRPVGLVVASIGAAAVGLLLTAFAIGSMLQGHGAFSGAIGMVLGFSGLVMVAAAVGLWQRRLIARGPVIATSVLAVIVALSMTESAPLAWVVAAVAALTGVAVALPSTSAGLVWKRGVTAPDGHLPTDGRGN